MPKYSDLEILEAMEQLAILWASEGIEKEAIDFLERVTHDVLEVLKCDQLDAPDDWIAGGLLDSLDDPQAPEIATQEPLAVKAYIILPEFGFVPILGQPSGPIQPKIARGPNP